MEQSQKKSVVRDFLEAFIIALLIALPIKFFIASPFIVVGSSMDNSFHSKDYLIVDKLVYRFQNPARGDVIVFNPPINTSEYYIKRVIGLPGETLHIEGNSVRITNTEHPNGFLLTEPYVSSIRASITDITLNAGQYFVMGDNRAVSSDSRVWGPIVKSEISGRADVRLFPFSAIGIMPGAITYK
ncbi:MAG: signal peptidase I [Patescibacteria group bacterium]